MSDDTAIETKGEYRVQYKRRDASGTLWETVYKGGDIELAERIFRSQTEQRFEVRILDRFDKSIRSFREPLFTLPVEPE